MDQKEIAKYEGKITYAETRSGMNSPGIVYGGVFYRVSTFNDIYEKKRIALRPTKFDEITRLRELSEGSTPELETYVSKVLGNGLTGLLLINVDPEDLHG